MTLHHDLRSDASGDRPPLPLGAALWAIARCALTSTRLLATRHVRQPTEHVGTLLHFADGSSARVYRETVVDHEIAIEPSALVVEFRLRWIRGPGHAVFRAESLLNTVLFIGFRGFVSKLWLTHDQHGSYRGVYEWDGPALAHAYARALWWILALVSDRKSIHYTVLPGWTRDEFLKADGMDDGVWWRVIGTSEQGEHHDSQGVDSRHRDRREGSADPGRRAARSR